MGSQTFFLATKLPVGYQLRVQVHVSQFHNYSLCLNADLAKYNNSESLVDRHCHTFMSRMFVDISTMQYAWLTVADLCTLINVSPINAKSTESYAFIRMVTDIV